MNISKRLNNVMAGGNLTIKDLSRWFNRPFATVRGWVRGRDMRAAPQDAEVILERLKLIERRIRKGAGLPVPPFTTNGTMRADSQRIAYLNKLMARKKL